jgi:hypothetical protein
LSLEIVALYFRSGGESRHRLHFTGWRRAAPKPSLFKLRLSGVGVIQALQPLLPAACKLLVDQMRPAAGHRDGTGYPHARHAPDDKSEAPLLVFDCYEKHNGASWMSFGLEDSAHRD